MTSDPPKATPTSMADVEQWQIVNETYEEPSLTPIFKKKGITLFTTIVGSHMWQMNHSQSDIDYNIIYLQPSREFLLGHKVHGKQKHSDIEDVTFHEIGNIIHQLINGNVNHIWAVMSPCIVNEKSNAIKNLRQIVVDNMAKNIYHSIAGMTKHNIYHFIEQGDRESLLYRKKLNVIGRTIQFGINWLLYGKALFEKTNITERGQLDDLKLRLDTVYHQSTLPERPDPTPFENYLIKWRLHALREEEFI